VYPVRWLAWMGGGAANVTDVPLSLLAMIAGVDRRMRTDAGEQSYRIMTRKRRALNRTLRR